MHNKILLSGALYVTDEAMRFFHIQMNTITLKTCNTKTRKKSQKANANKSCSQQTVSKHPRGHLAINCVTTIKNIASPILHPQTSE